MSRELTMPPVATDGARTRHPELWAALAASLFVLALNASSGFQGLVNAGSDNDSLMRMVEIRDWMGGQGWFDLHQYRMGQDGGFLMHWSRLVDAPIAGMIALFSALTRSASGGEVLTLIVWPTLLFAVALFLILKIAKRFAGESAMLPATIVGAASLHFVAIFAPGNIDHHNFQLVLALAMLASFVARPSLAAGVTAGACASLMLAVGMETLPYVAVAGASAALLYAMKGEEAARLAFGFGIAFAAISAAVFVGTVPSSNWGVAACDAFSVVQFAIAAVAGLGLAAIVSVPAAGKTAISRMIALAVLGVGVAVLIVTAFPQCLADPYAGLDPRLRTYWLSAILEAQPIWVLAVQKPSMAAGFYGPPLIAMVWLAARLYRQPSREAAIVVAMLSTAILVSFWQVRGAMFSLPFAVVPLSAWIAEARGSARAGGGRMLAKMLLAWVASFAVVWSAAAARLDRPAPAGNAGSGSAAISGACQNAADFAPLAALPATRVLAVSNLGAAILKYTPHRVFAGPYHRNIAGNLFALDAQMADAEEARKMLAAKSVDLVAVCPGNDETAAIAGWAPNGMLARLAKGDVPDWLGALPGRGSLKIYRVKPAS